MIVIMMFDKDKHTNKTFKLIIDLRLVKLISYLAELIRYCAII